MRLLALDQAPENIGWAFGDTAEGGPSLTGCHQFESFGKNGRLLQRAIRKVFDPLITRLNPEVVSVEQIVLNVRRPNTITWHQQFAAVAAIESLCDYHDVDSFESEIGPWRKRFIGTAGAPKHMKTNAERAAWFKQKAMARCAELGWPVETHHAAEACGIWDYAAWKLDAAFRSSWRKAENVRQAA